MEDMASSALHPSPRLLGSPLTIKTEVAPSPTMSPRSGSKTSLTKENQPDLLRCKRRIDFNGNPVKKAAVARRNERERNRVKLVNLGFATLREHVPEGQKNKKMSKVDTLKSAVDYIKYLQALLDNHDAMNATIQGQQVVAVNQGVSRHPTNVPLHHSPMKSDISDIGSVESQVSTGYGSDTSEVFSPAEEELLDFASWFQ